MSPGEVQQFTTRGGIRIYRLPLNVFPPIVGYAHLICSEAHTTLVDVGSGLGESNADLDAGLRQVCQTYGERAAWSDLTQILISHGHIDHFGGLGYVRERTRAPIGVHQLDWRVIAEHTERVNLIADRLQVYFTKCGLSDESRDDLVSMYRMHKELFRSVPPDFTIQEPRRQLGDLLLIHVPGHCSGQIVIQVEDILLSADHILPETSPHLAPESLSLNTGLRHYLASLDKVEFLVPEIRLTLGGHEAPLDDLAGRIAGIRLHHEQRLGLILAMLNSPQTIAEISRQLFPDAAGYHILLALEEAGAHVEFLKQVGLLKIESTNGREAKLPQAIRYQRSLSSPRTFTLSGTRT